MTLIITYELLLRDPGLNGRVPLEALPPEDSRLVLSIGSFPGKANVSTVVYSVVGHLEHKFFQHGMVSTLLHPEAR